MPAAVADAAPAVTATEQDAIGVSAVNPTVANATAISSTPAKATVLAGSDSSAARNPTPTTLTADMVLGYLGNLPAASEAQVAVRFEPAMPQRAAAGGAGNRLLP